MNLKLYIRIVETRVITEKDRKDFETLDFDPNELLQLKEMEKRKLLKLMVFCGIRVFNGRPVIILNENEMRMAYVVWRADRIKRKKESIIPKWERGMKWVNRISKIAANSVSS